MPTASDRFRPCNVAALLRFDPKQKNLASKMGGLLIVRVRGDGRQYYLNLHVPTRHMAFSYRAPIDTVANQWQEIRIPLSEFYGTSFGRQVPNAELDPEEVNSLVFCLQTSSLIHSTWSMQSDPCSLIHSA